MASSLDDSKASRKRRKRDDDDFDDEDTVTCFFSGREVPRKDALRIRLGPGQRVWMLKEYTRDG